MTNANASSHSVQPLSVQLGFSGSRVLVQSGSHPEISEHELEDRVVDYLADCMKRLRSELGLSEHHFFCGLSQIAVGADTAFSRACAALRIPQCLLLPQSLDNYLDAVSGRGVPDFSAAQKVRARALASADHVIQHRVVSDSTSRDDRFEDAAVEVVRSSDVMLCVIRAEPDDKPGGTLDVIRRARTHGKAALSITVVVKEGKASFEERWHGREMFVVPALPAALGEWSSPRASATDIVPDCLDYARELKALTSLRARERSTLFKHSAWIIIGTHVAATLLASLALAFHGSQSTFILPALLLLEVGLLTWGFQKHQRLHRAETSYGWALARLVAEISRSMLAIGHYPAIAQYLFTLPFPAALYPLLRTLNVLQLHSSLPNIGKPWETFRTAYIADRLAGANGQIAFYERETRNATRSLTRARGTFVVLSVGAICASLLKLTMVTPGVRIERLMEFATWVDANHGALTTVIALAAVILPLFAVAALSLAAALDLEARANTFREVGQYLKVQKVCLDSASSKREFDMLMLETERRLLGETVNWFSRRWFTGVA